MVNPVNSIIYQRDQVRFDEAASSLTCGYCNRTYSTGSEMESEPSVVYTNRGRTKNWIAVCKECAFSSAEFGADKDAFDITTNPTTGREITENEWNEIWRHFEKFVSNVTSGGQLYLTAVELIQLGSNAPRSLGPFHVSEFEDRSPEEIESNERTIWPLIHRIIALSDRRVYPTFEIMESTRVGPELQVTYFSERPEGI
jgi:hypothetical protein